jgi:hypothetical protein
MTFAFGIIEEQQENLIELLYLCVSLVSLSIVINTSCLFINHLALLVVFIVGSYPYILFSGNHVAE